tara:strand:+ start:29373 stop:29606 length:234 start_codon:yes stop_codon:yes gene_type:complete
MNGTETTEKSRDVFKTNLALFRKAAGMTIASAAARTGVSRSAWVKYERGERFPKPELLDAVAKVFQIKVMQLFVNRS